MEVKHKPIVATICEHERGGHDVIPILPELPGSLDLFQFHDPFGLRRAVVPVLLKEPDGVVRGMGTAFHIDGWGTFLTADHVIESVRRYSNPMVSDGAERRFSYGPLDVYPMLLLGIGLVFGRVGVPQQAMALVANIRSPIRERMDPLAALRGQTELEAASDVAVMRLAEPIPEEMIGTVPVRFSGWRPCTGDSVVALGFPDLVCQPIDEEGLRYLLSDGMSASYGRIIEFHPNGRGSDPTPVVEVEATWPGGMSGGPVFNVRGEVIGIVSRSLTSCDAGVRNGCAFCFELAPWLGNWVPSLDKSNPRWRLGWAVLREDPWDFAGFYEQKGQAHSHKLSLGTNYEVFFGSNRIGSDDFVQRTSLKGGGE